MSHHDSKDDADAEGLVLVGMALVLSAVAFYVLFDYGTGPLLARELSWELGFYGFVAVSLLAYAGSEFHTRVLA